MRAREQAPEWVLGVAPAEPVAGRTLTGLPGSPGEAEGPVFLVRGMEDFMVFPKGAVLVARTTNPTWTPLFYSARAVITESGGPLSHGAVTACEMQIPAVMFVRNCMSVLKNDQRVRDRMAACIYFESLLGRVLKESLSCPWGQLLLRNAALQFSL